MGVVVTPEDHNAPILPRDVQSGMALARAAGHSWNDINDHLKAQQQIALDRDFRRRADIVPALIFWRLPTAPCTKPSPVYFRNGRTLTIAPPVPCISAAPLTSSGLSPATTMRQEYAPFATAAAANAQDPPSGRSAGGAGQLLKVAGTFAPAAL